jgi:RimJ/RimL family protein N-acetyltransferase
MSDEIVSMKTATAADGQMVLQLLQKLQTESNVVLIAHLETMSVAKAKADLDQLSERDDSIVLLAMYGEQAIGILTVTPADENQGELGVAVLKDYWHNGIGTMLVDEAVYWLNHYSSLSGLKLDVFASNHRAHAIYERLGFVETGTRKTKDAAGNEQTAIMMTCPRNQ